MTPRPISQPDATPLRIAIVTMDSHLSGVIAAARAALAADHPSLVVELHTAERFAADPACLAACVRAIETADIVIATMLFLDDHIRLVRPHLEARRMNCDAMLCILSAAEIVNLTRLGRLDMSRQKNPALEFLRSLRKRGGKEVSAAESQLRMLRRLPRLLRLIPGTAQDLRNFFLGMSYWLAGSADNIEGLLRLLVARYAAGPRAALRSQAAIAPPRDYPETGLYHPRLPGRIATDEASLPRIAGSRGTIGLILLRSLVLSGDVGQYDGVIAAFEAAGFRTLPVFAAGLDARPAIARYLAPDGAPVIDALVSLTGFSLVGGPAYNDSKSAEAVLAGLDLPYISAHALEFQSIAAWEADPRGLTPIEATMMISLPELDGGIMPMTYGGRAEGQDDGGDGVRRMSAHPERTAMLAARVARLVELRRTARAERRIGIVIFNFPPNSGATGTAAYLSVFESLFNTLAALRAAGYTVDLPADVAALRHAVCVGNAQDHGAAANVAAKIPRDAHLRAEPHLAAIEAVWGPAPGRHDTDGASLFVLGARFGNVFIGVQPVFGHEGDPMRLLFEGGFAPTHAFSAFYRWLRQDFGAHALLHFGTHGALEFMPGKHAGLSAACWPDRLIAEMPNFCLYAANNPSEGMLAKRRANATLISHLTPPVTEAGLYRGLADLKASVFRWRALPPEAGAEERQGLAALIQAEAARLDLAPTDPADLSWADADAAIARLHASLLDVEYALIPVGLHVVGQPPGASQRAELLDAAGITDPARRAETDALLAADSELPAIIHALDGGYIRPAPGGDLLRNPEILPTGRNIYGFDPFRMPGAFAMDDGARQADRLLARHMADCGRLPETVAMLLWGSDNLKSEGGPIAQALCLVGARPRRDSYGRLAGAELVPLAELGRPRIDVIVTLSGIFRDLLPLQTKLLAEALLLAAQADEPETQNFVARHARAHIAAHGGTIETAALRVFSNADGTYGANVNQLVESGTWQTEDELGDAFLRRKGFAYGTDGRPTRCDAVLGGVLKTVDLAYQNLESLDLGITTVDHYFDGLGGISRAVRAARGSDAAVYIGDQTTGAGTVRSLSEQVSLETRTRTLNPKYFEAMLAHGAEGVRHLEAAVTNTLGWSATTGQVDPWIYREIGSVFMLDPEMRRRLAELNPVASVRIANRLLEAHERHYWSPDEAMLDALRRAGAELEDRLEGLDMEQAA